MREEFVEESVKGPRMPFLVGPWRVEPALHRLEREGESKQIELKVMETLCHLASRPGTVVSRDELLEVVWEDRHVSEDLPRRAIYELRKALGDNSRDPSFIETIPRSGYRLIAPVEQAAELPPEPPPTPSPALHGARPPSATSPAPAATRRHRPLQRYLLIAVLAVVGLLAVGLLSREGLDSSGAPAPSKLRMTPLTSLPGLEYDPAFSPDGSRVAYLGTDTSEADAEIHLYTQLVGTFGGSTTGLRSARSAGRVPAELGPALRLSEQASGFSHPIESPTWSPDGTRLAYLRAETGQGWGLYQIPALGGSERKILDLGMAGVSGLAWSPDGRWLVLGLRPRADAPLALHRLPMASPGMDSEHLEALTEPPAGSVGDQFPTFSPDGSWLAFLRTRGQDASEVRLLPMGGQASAGLEREGRPLLPEAHKIADLDWSADGQRLLLAVYEAGRHRIWSLEVATGRVDRLHHLGEHTRFLSASRAGERLTYARTTFEFGVWRLDLASGEAKPVPSLSSTFYDEGLARSPDGSLLALASTRSGNYEIWINDLEGRRPLRLTSFEGAVVGQPRWLPDGRSLVFHANAEESFDLWQVETAGGSPQPLSQDPGNEKAPSVSADGKRIYFASDRSGDWEVWSLPVGGGPAHQHTEAGGYYAQESPDGSWLYFTRWQQHGLWRMGSQGKGRQEQVLGTELKSWDWGNWVVTEAGIVLITSRDGVHEELALYSPESASYAWRYALPGTPVRPSLTLLPDAALFVQLDRVESDLVLVDGALY